MSRARLSRVLYTFFTRPFQFLVDFVAGGWRDREAVDVFGEKELLPSVGDGTEQRAWEDDCHSRRTLVPQRNEGKEPHDDKDESEKSLHVPLSECVSVSVWGYSHSHSHPHSHSHAHPLHIHRSFPLNYRLYSLTYRVYSTF